MLLLRACIAVYDWFQPFIAAGEIRHAAPALYVPLILGPTSSFARHWLAHRLTLDMSEVAETLAKSAWNSLHLDKPCIDKLCDATLPEDIGTNAPLAGRSPT